MSRAHSFAQGHGDEVPQHRRHTRKKRVMKRKRIYVKPTTKAVAVCAACLLAGSGPYINQDGTVTNPNIKDGNPSEIDAGKNTDLWTDEDE